MGKKYGGADSLIPAACWICTVNSCKYGNAGLLQFSMPEKRSAATTSIGIELFLLGQFYTTAIYQPDQRNIEPL